MEGDLPFLSFHPVSIANKLIEAQQHVQYLENNHNEGFTVGDTGGSIGVMIVWMIILLVLLIVSIYILYWSVILTFRYWEYWVRMTREVN